MNRISITGVDVNAITSDASNLPVIAVAASGGGYRALMNGAGAIAAFDNRTRGANDAGGLGGLLQSSTYVAGLSGGSWLVGSLYVNNFTSVQSLVDTTPAQSGSVWQFENSIFEGPDTGGLQILDSAEYYTTIYNEVQGKKDAGFNTSITDYWGRALSFQLINATNGGPGITWSSISLQPSFASGSTPMPLVVADTRAPGQLDISTNTTVFEFNPWEMGSYDPTLFGFAPLKYVGSQFQNGALPQNDPCIAGFDNAGFVMGTSSSLFNQFFLQIGSVSSVPSLFKNAITQILAGISADQDDIADWYPNPFYLFNPNGGFTQAQSQRLTLVDGGEDGQNIPLNPLIQPVRNVSVIFAVDSSADNNFNWPNGTALRATYERSLSPIQNGTGFPAIPDADTFINLGLNKRPSWFGCDPKNITSGKAPLIVYLPNAPYSAYSNVSTFDPSYNISQRNSIIQNGINVATMANGTLDGYQNWPKCVGCATLLRTWQYANQAIPEECQQCMTQYCWNGTLAETPDQTINSYQPNLILGASANTAGGVTGTPKKTGAAAGKSGANAFAVSAISVLAAGFAIFA